jgi:hypothetical protein
MSTALVINSGISLNGTELLEYVRSLSALQILLEVPFLDFASKLLLAM